MSLLSRSLSLVFTPSSIIKTPSPLITLKYPSTMEALRSKIRYPADPEKVVVVGMAAEQVSDGVRGRDGLYGQRCGSR